MAALTGAHANVHELQFDWGATVLIALINFRCRHRRCRRPTLRRHRGPRYSGAVYRRQCRFTGDFFWGHVGPVYLFQLWMHLNQPSRRALILSDYDQQRFWRDRNAKLIFDCLSVRFMFDVLIWCWDFWRKSQFDALNRLSAGQCKVEGSNRVVQVIAGYAVQQMHLPWQRSMQIRTCAILLNDSVSRRIIVGSGRGSLIFFYLALVQNM